MTSPSYIIITDFGPQSNFGNLSGESEGKSSALLKLLYIKWGWVLLASAESLIRRWKVCQYLTVTTSVKEADSLN